MYLRRNSYDRAFLVASMFDIAIDFKIDDHMLNDKNKIKFNLMRIYITLILQVNDNSFSTFFELK